MKVALVQLNPTIGAMDANARRLVDALTEAARQGADLAVVSELYLTGYPPTDLFERPGFLPQVAAAEARVRDEMPPGLVAVVGTVTPRRAASGRPLHNSAVVVRRGAELARFHKTLLPAYDVFDEPRYFEPGTDPGGNVFSLGEARIGVTICEDIWTDAALEPRARYPVDPVAALAGARLDRLVNLSSSPWSVGRERVRRALLERLAARHGLEITYVNQVGANDALIFDGRSQAVGPTGLRAELPAFAEAVRVVGPDERPSAERAHDDVAELHAALVLGIRDYFAKVGASRAVIALSGGIDSAVTAALAVEALGRSAVSGLALPSRYSSPGSVTDARALAENLGIPLHVLSIEPMFGAALATLAPLFAGGAAGLAEENLQSRIRGVLVMAHANQTGALVLTTGNKSESAVGYCTLYGDTCGALAPLADCYKRDVYALARHINRARLVIPLDTITKPPSAELRPDQKDEDSLPPYDALDEMLRRLIEDRQSVDEVAAALGRPREEVSEIARKLHASEFKRRQLAPGLRVTRRAWFGRSYPLAARFGETTG